MSDESFVQSANQNEGDHSDNKKLGQHTHAQPYDKPADAEYDCLMEDIEGEHGLVAVGEYSFFQVHVFCTKAQYEDDAAPAHNAVQNLEEYILQ